ncbi:MAG: hypothetical protein Roseis2KO_31710 [Roseivirga sp.]
METSQDFVSELGYLSLAVRLKRISDQMMHGARQLYKRQGLDIEPNWYLIFKLLENRSCLSITEIGEELGFSHPSVISIVRKMREKGFLTCTADPNDSRRQLIKLSKKAEAALPRFEAFWQAGERSIASLFSPDSDFLVQLAQLEQQYHQSDFMTRTLNELSHDE